MNPEQIELVKSSFSKVAPIAETAAELFYQRLFELDPSLKPLFKGDMTEQGRKLMAMLATVVNKLDQLGDLMPTIQSLGKRHIDYGVKPAHYDTVGEALLWTLEQGLDSEFTAEVKDAWVAAYSALAGAMIASAEAAA